MNKVKLKRVIIVASFIIIMMTSILKYPSSFANSNANLYLVFDKKRRKADKKLPHREDTPTPSQLFPEDNGGV